MILILKVVHWTRRKQFWQLCWKLFAGSSRHFCLRIQTEMKKLFLKKTSSKSSPTFRMQYWQIWRNFFFRTKIYFRSNTKLNETWQNFAKKNREALWTRGMQFWQRCWKFSPEVWTIIAQSPKTILKNLSLFWILKKVNLSQSAPLNT